MTKVAVLGATGYTGIELVRLLLLHPQVELSLVSSDSRRGEKLSDAHPHFWGISDLVFSAPDPGELPPGVELVFCALPHGSSAEIVRSLKEAGVRVIDLSADFRLKQPSKYQEWYQRTHPCPELLEEAVYGLPEIYPQQVKAAHLVANPGCYPTSVLLPLIPLARQGLLPEKGVVVDSKSGVSGAGRSPAQGFHFPECNESFKAYRVASHQHTPEMEQELSFNLGSKLNLIFTPHLVPVNRGIISTSYLLLNNEAVGEKELRNILVDFYGETGFVKLLKPGVFPETRWVKGANYCHINFRLDERTGTVVMVSALDNLVKGAAGQAVQNMNLMMGLPEKTGLTHSALVP